ncbi:FdrA family protein [Actinomadura craniellae]|uniref:FdrA family protein n=2 Tax=Actinomadura craniellae TaxID=2231787 RepID=A0A365H2I0_9ACTN|nr:FdrA family protein [Actinomadura craniellae]
MRVSRTLAERSGVRDAMVAMATGLNLDLLDRLGFTAPDKAGPNDLLVALRADDEPALADARQALDALLAEAARPAPGGLGAPPSPRTTGAAAARAPADLALISVPGPYAFAEAMDALSAGLNVMVFSDNVPVAQEIRLKEEAARRGLIVMGPDCGTAVVGGVGLGFANAVRPGPVGIIGAAGTGSQQLMCLLDTAGVGVSQVLGVGGRDLSAQVSGRSTLQALAALDADPATELIVVVSKPPAPRVAELIRAAARRLDTPVVFALLGPGQDDLTAAAGRVLAALGRPEPRWPRWPAAPPPEARPGALRGLFAGGTLCNEAMLIASRALGEIRSNIPLRPEWAWPGGATGGHLMIDFGEDSLTRGRAHPMIDPALRLDRLAGETAGDDCGVVLLDVVLGYAADPDPAAALAPAIEAAVARGLGVVVSLCGTADDPQDRDRQAAALSGAGAAVFASNAEAARHAVALAGGTPEGAG